MTTFDKKLERLAREHEELLSRPNPIDDDWDNGLYHRYRYPVLTRRHAPLLWRYDLDSEANPYLMERLGINAIFNPGALYRNGKVYLVCRMEGLDRKSFFAVAESRTGIDQFQFWPEPVSIPPSDREETNLYDMRLVQHEDGWIYGVFCVESKDNTSKDPCRAKAQCGIARTLDLKTWERLPNLCTSSPQQRNVVLHPEFIDGRYAFYTRPQDGFLDTGSQCGIGGGYCNDLQNPVLEDECIVDTVAYHTIKELKNGPGPAPLKTKAGWLHIAHGVRDTASGLRYVLYAFLCDSRNPFLITHQPGGYLMAPWQSERTGDVSNVLFCNGAVLRPDGTILIYYASSDTRIHVASSTADRMVDYVQNTPQDPASTHGAVAQRLKLIRQNRSLANRNGEPLLHRIAGHAPQK